MTNMKKELKIEIDDIKKYENNLSTLIDFNKSCFDAPLKTESQVLLSYQWGCISQEIYTALFACMENIDESTFYLIEFFQNNEKLHIWYNMFYEKTHLYKITYWTNSSIEEGYEEFIEYFSQVDSIIIFSDSFSWSYINFWQDFIWYFGWIKSNVTIFDKIYPNRLEDIIEYQKDISPYQTSYDNFNNLLLEVEKKL